MLLEINNLTVSYGAIPAIENISINVNNGEIVAIIGPNGAGKSTVLKAITGLIAPCSGMITFNDKCITGQKAYQLVEQGIVLVPEGRRLFVSLTVMENLEMGAYTRNDKKRKKNDIEKVFNLFPILKERYKQRSGTLSSGEQQMLSIGRALMTSPKLLIMDEPSIGLSPKYTELVFEKIREINKDGVSILMVEQNVRMALEHSDRGYVFTIGKIIMEDKSKKLLMNDNLKKAIFGV